MKDVMRYKGYVGTVESSEEDGCLFGRLGGINDIISYEGESLSEIRQAFHEAVDDYLADCEATGKQPEKPYPGSFPDPDGAALPFDLTPDAEIIAVMEEPDAGRGKQHESAHALFPA